MRYQSYLNTAQKIIQTYTGEEPLSNFLKSFFAANKKYGAKDRKHIASLCYAFFRLGHAAQQGDIIQNILIGLFLSQSFYSEIIQHFHPEWNKWIAQSLAEKVAYIKFNTDNIFVLKNELSAEINFTNYCQSFLIQPQLFLRARPHKINIVTQKLQRAKIPLTVLEDNCIALSNATPLKDIISADNEAVIQDYNSQKVFNFLKLYSFNNLPLKVWDCCAASGGKSILLFDFFKKNIELTVSDVRLKILLNLHQRFAKAGIKNYNYFIADLNSPQFKLEELPTTGNPKIFIENIYDLIICDVPCTGSGTWSRTPENVFYFKPQLIDDFAARQKQIVSNVIPNLKPEGLLFYITCSVFKKENEAVAQYIKEKFKLQLLHIEILKGYDCKADTMFVAVFKK